MEGRPPPSWELDETALVPPVPYTAEERAEGSMPCALCYTPRVDENLLAFNYELSSNLVKPPADARNMMTLRRNMDDLTQKTHHCTSDCSDSLAYLSGCQRNGNSGRRSSRQKNVDGAMQGFTYRLTTIGVFVLLALASCDRNQSQTPQQSTVSPTPSGNSQTKALRAASAVGYDGKQLQKQVDKVLEEKEKRDRDLENKLNDTGP